MPPVARTRYGVSPWVHRRPEARRPSLPRLSEDLRVEVAVVGGGLTGCATALACASAGLSVVLLEADRIGHGRTGAGTGLILPEPGPAFRELAARHGLRLARLVFERWRKGAIDAATQLRRLRVSCDVEPVDLLRAAGGDPPPPLRRECQARVNAGLADSWLEPAAFAKATRLRDTAGMRLKGGSLIDPYRACLGLAAAARRRGALLVERTPVVGTRSGHDGVDVLTERRTVRASTVVVATGAPTAAFASLRRHFTARETYLALTGPVPRGTHAALWAPGVLLVDGLPAVRRLRWVTRDRILVAGADQPETPERRRAQVLVQRTGALMYDLLMTYPAIAGLQPEYGWHLSYAGTADGLMYVGPHRHYPRHLFAFGGTSETVTGAFVAARMLARAANGAPDKGDEVFSWTR